MVKKGSLYSISNKAFSAEFEKNVWTASRSIELMYSRYLQETHTTSQRDLDTRTCSRASNLRARFDVVPADSMFKPFESCKYIAALLKCKGS